MHNVYAGSLAASLSLTQENHKCTYVERQLTCSRYPHPVVYFILE